MEQGGWRQVGWRLLGQIRTIHFARNLPPPSSAQLSPLLPCTFPRDMIGPSASQVTSLPTCP